MIKFRIKEVKYETYSVFYPHTFNVELDEHYWRDFYNDGKIVKFFDIKNAFDFIDEYKKPYEKETQIIYHNLDDVIDNF